MRKPDGAGRVLAGVPGHVYLIRYPDRSYAIELDPAGALKLDDVPACKDLADMLEAFLTLSMRCIADTVTKDHGAAGVPVVRLSFAKPEGT